MNEIAIAVVLLTSGWMLKLWLSHRERMRQLTISAREVGVAEERLARVENAVEAIAVEVERIGEGQRYVTALLGERPKPALETDSRPDARYAP